MLEISDDADGYVMQRTVVVTIPTDVYHIMCSYTLCIIYSWWRAFNLFIREDSSPYVNGKLYERFEMGDSYPFFVIVLVIWLRHCGVKLNVRAATTYWVA